MIDYFNPFEYEAANKFTSYEQILDFYIEDHNYSRFIRSRRNIVLTGERGTGKSMTLLFNSLPVQQTKTRIEGGNMSYDVICIYVPCNTPLTHKKEYQLLEQEQLFQASIVSEHFFVVPLMYEIADSLSKIDGLMESVDEDKLKNEIRYVTGIEMLQNMPFFDALKLALQKEVLEAQRAMNARRIDAFYENAFTFSSGLLPLLTCFRKIPKLKKSHFSLMIDDAHDLNTHQKKALNSWIAYRDNALFSFKVAMAKADRIDFQTSSGGTILEGHDFTMVDLERPYQNQESDFGKLAKSIISKRLDKIGFKGTPEKFFPVSPKFEKDLAKCKEDVLRQAQVKYENGTQKQINDYVYKYTRAEYFRKRPAKSNLPTYSGFDILVHLSTGVIRNLLEPCFLMYDHEYSEKSLQGIPKESIKIDMIPYSVQNKVIMDKSRQKWDWIRDGLDSNIEGCSREQAKQIYQLFDKLANLFKQRLLHHKSEPRAISFTISETNHENYENIQELLKIARKAQLLYSHTSSAKDDGARETYYVPNRILMPIRGLDPHGQHARVSLRASNLWAAAKDNNDIPFDPNDDQPLEIQQGLPL
jgi:hypothetical protein